MMYSDASASEDHPADTTMTALYRQLDDHDLGDDASFDVDAGLLRLLTRIQHEVTSPEPAVIISRATRPGFAPFRLQATEAGVGRRYLGLYPAVFLPGNEQRRHSSRHMVNFAVALEFAQPVNRAHALGRPHALGHPHAPAHNGSLGRLRAHTDNLDHTRTRSLDVTLTPAHTHTGTHSLDLDLDLANLIRVM